MTPKRLAALGLVAGLFAGGAAGAALGIPGLAGAQTDESTTTTEPTPARPADKGQWLNDALAPLVEQGTISQAQADAVIDALQAARPMRGPHGHGGPGMPGMRGGPGLRGGLDAAAGALGITIDELRAALAGGQSLAEVAKGKNIDVQKVVDAIVAEAKSHLAEKVSGGAMTQAEADALIARLTEKTEAFVNGEAPAFRFGPGPRGHRHGFRGDGGPAPAEATPSSTTSGSTTSA